MSRSDGEQERAELLKHRLLRKAAAIVRSGGIESLSMRKVASALNYTTTTIYYHFGSRSALLDGVRSLAWQKLHESLAAATDSPVWETRAIEIAVAYLEYALAEPALYHVCFLAGREAGESGYAPSGEWEIRSFDLLQNHINEGIEAGSLQFDDPRRGALHFWSWSHGLASLLIDGRIPLPPENRARQVAIRSLVEEFVGRLFTQPRPAAPGT